MSAEYKGCCLCRAIQFSVSGFGPAANCHCTMCRKFHGAAFGTLVSVQGLKWHSGEYLVKDDVASNGTIRTFCIECGSSLGFRPKDRPRTSMELAIATLDDDIPIEITAQIYTAYKANWYRCIKDVAVFSEGHSG